MSASTATQLTKPNRVGHTVTNSLKCAESKPPELSNVTLVSVVLFCNLIGLFWIGSDKVDLGNYLSAYWD